MLAYKVVVRISERINKQKESFNVELGDIKPICYGAALSHRTKSIKNTKKQNV